MKIRRPAVVDVFSLPEGDVKLIRPSVMSKDSFEDFKVWLELMTRRAERAIRVEDDSKPEDS